MKRIFLLIVAMFVLGSVLSAAESIVKKPFNGTNLDGWKLHSQGSREHCWKVGTPKIEERAVDVLPLKSGEKGSLCNQVDAHWGARNPFADSGDRAKIDEWNRENPKKGLDIYTEEVFGNCTVTLEFIIPKGSNSGVYLMGEYEVQIADSFGKPNDKLGQGDMGAIYSAAAPSVNAAAAPGEWQKFEIEFVAPKFDANGNKTANGLFKKIVLNGKIVQENVEVKGPTGGGLTMKEAPVGPLMFQGNHGPVAFRNIEITINK